MKIIGAGFKTVHDKDFSITRPHGYGDFLLLIMKTQAFHVIHNEKKVVPAHSFILYDKTTPQHYGATGNEYIDDWVHFSMDERDHEWFESCEFPFNTIIELKDTALLSVLIHNITFEFYSAGTNRQITSCLYLQILFNKIIEFMEADKVDTLRPFYSQLVNLRTEIYNVPDNDWMIEEMAKQLNLSTSYFQHIYKKLFGISVINDVIESRISHSKQLLSGTNLPVKKIAALCGYEYDVFFMRQFKRRTGITPKEYREQETSHTSLSTAFQPSTENLNETKKNTAPFLCRKGCAACCIAISISSPLPGMPKGKPAGIRCVNLSADNGCTIHGLPQYPAICRSFSADPTLCGKTNKEAFENIALMEKLTC